jgi:hypothetical protein
VDALHAPQLVGVERLHAEAEAVEARLLQRAQLLQRHAAGVRLAGDFGVWWDDKSAREVFQNARQRRAVQVGGRAAAEKDRVEARACVGRLFDLAVQRVHEAARPARPAPRSY